MGIFRRSPAQKAPDVRVMGLEAAVGLVPDELGAGSGTEPLGTTCGTCGATGRIDMIDMTERRAYLTCPRCERTWDTDRESVPPRAFFSRAQ